MEYKHLSVERRGGVLTCTLSNPPNHTLNSSGVQELGVLLDELQQDRSLRVLILTGGGEGVFIAHYEVEELAASAEQQSQQPADSALELDRGRLHAFHRICLQLERLPAVTIAAINGNAAGGGCELSLACDFRLMADGPFGYGLPETSVGIIPGAGGTQRFARLLGTARAIDLILHGRILGPAEAHELGLIHRLYAPETFRDQAFEFARNLAARSPIALAAAKEAIWRGAQTTLEDGLAIEQECFARTMRSRDAAGAMRAWTRGELYEWLGE